MTSSLLTPALRLGFSLVYKRSLLGPGAKELEHLDAQQAGRPGPRAPARQHDPAKAVT